MGLIAATVTIGRHDPAGYDPYMPKLLYTGIANPELRLRTGIIVGRRNTECGEKQNDFRLELRAGCYF